MKKTLKEYLDQATRTVTSRVNEIKAQDEEITRLQLALLTDDTLMNEAVQTGNQEQYQKAAFDRQYHAARIETLRDHPNTVMPSKAQFDAIVKDVNERYNSARREILSEVIKAMRPQVERYDALIAERDAILAEYAKIDGYQYAARNIVSDWKCDEMHELLNSICDDPGMKE